MAESVAVIGGGAWGLALAASAARAGSKVLAHSRRTLDGALPKGVAQARDLAQIGRGSAVTNIQEHDVKIRLLGDFAIIHARTTYTKPDGSTGGGRYTDDWQRRPEGWRCVSAHVSRF